MEKNRGDSHPDPTSLIPFEKGWDWRWRVDAIKKLEKSSVASTLEISRSLCDAKDRLAPPAFRILRENLHYDKSYANNLIKVGRDKRLYDPKSSDRLPREPYRLFELSRTPDHELVRVVRLRRTKRPRKPGEPLEIKEAAEKLGWSYHTALRYFEHVDGVIIKQGRKKRKITIPIAVFDAEYRKFTTRTADSVEMADKRMQELQALKPARA